MLVAKLHQSTFPEANISARRGEMLFSIKVLIISNLSLSISVRISDIICIIQQL